MNNNGLHSKDAAFAEIILIRYTRGVDKRKFREQADIKKLLDNLIFSSHLTGD